MTKTNRLTLSLFNAVIAPIKSDLQTDLQLDKTIQYGYIIAPRVANLGNVDYIINFLNADYISGERLNQASFHKSWYKVANATDQQLRAEQLMHYFSTYGLKAQGLFSEDMVYIPTEVLNVPAEDVDKIPFKIINGITSSEVVARCIAMLNGVALKQETIKDILDLLYELKTPITQQDLDNGTVKNKEARIMVMKERSLIPSNNTEMLRYLIYLATGSTLIINNPQVMREIETSKLDIRIPCAQYGLNKLSQEFLRYKDFYLAFKRANNVNAGLVNRLRKLAKKTHKPMPVDYLNNITSMKDIDMGELLDELDKVNIFRKIRVYDALNMLAAEVGSAVYRIRNGKSFAKEDNRVASPDQLEAYSLTREHIAECVSDNVNGMKIYFPTNVRYPVPTTEKQFIGNIPSGTMFDFDSDAVLGVYWESAYGVEDIDLSLMNGHSKIGWNTDYKSEDALYSGDVTHGGNGASEFMYIKNSLDTPSLLMSNLYCGEIGCTYKIIIGKDSRIDSGNFQSDYMLDPNNIILQVTSKMTSKEQVVGLVYPKQSGGISFALTDFSSGSVPVCGNREDTKHYQNFMFTKYGHAFGLKELLLSAGAIESTEDDCDVDLSVNALEKDTILNLLQ